MAAHHDDGNIILSASKDVEGPLTLSNWKKRVVPLASILSRRGEEACKEGFSGKREGDQGSLPQAEGKP
jgi:hypothetical protein